MFILLDSLTKLHDTNLSRVTDDRLEVYSIEISEYVVVYIDRQTRITDLKVNLWQYWQGHQEDIKGELYKRCAR